MKNSLSRSVDLNHSQYRAVFDLVRTNALPADALRALYRRELGALARAGLITRTETDTYIVTPERPASQPPKVVLVNLNVRVRPELKAMLEALAKDGGQDMSDLVRPMLERGTIDLAEARTSANTPSTPRRPASGTLPRTGT